MSSPRMIAPNDPLTQAALTALPLPRLVALHSGLMAAVAAAEHAWEQAPTAALPPSAWDAAILPFLADTAALELTHQVLCRRMGRAA